ncbi:MAG TPA: class I SAM-dependent methyltransferase [Candidatus Acidoferrales bacterium]|nr:class I SAM-dependent methyltransferase [Candidatus Acidoferrales bacterium]
MSSEFQSRFGHIAEEFERYRPDYPPELFEHILAAVPADRRECALDLGAGTGKSTRALIPHFREVIAVEPDPGMSAKLKQEAPSIIVHSITAEDFQQPSSTVDLVAVGNALHWMDLPRVFANVHSWLRSAGIFAVFDRPLPKTTLAIDAITLAEMRGPWKPYRDQRLKHDKNWEEKVRAAPGFQIVESTKFSYIVPMSPFDFTGFWRSTSYGSAYARSLSEPETYWRNLESRFAEAAAGAAIPVDLSPTLVISRKT